MAGTAAGLLQAQMHPAPSWGAAATGRRCRCLQCCKSECHLRNSIIHAHVQRIRQAECGDGNARGHVAATSHNFCSSTLYRHTTASSPMLLTCTTNCTQNMGIKCRLYVQTQCRKKGSRCSLSKVMLFWALSARVTVCRAIHSPRRLWQHHGRSSRWV